jgi:single-stranded-DNA-specific exonuclease
MTEIIERGAKPILTCDTGITAHEAVAYAQSRDVDFVITDHHEPGEFCRMQPRLSIPSCCPKTIPWQTWLASEWRS